jgi:hypothetical protein
MARHAQRRLGRWGAVKLAKRIGISAPVVGALFALGAAAAAIRRKGVVRGTADTALNAIPVVGTAKTAVELMRGRDFFKDLPPNAASTQRARSSQPQPPRAKPLGYWRG